MVASRMVSAFSRWRRYDEGRQDLAKSPSWDEDEDGIWRGLELREFVKGITISTFRDFPMEGNVTEPSWTEGFSCTCACKCGSSSRSFTCVNASFCKPNTLNSAVVRGKIVICSIERIGDDRPAKAREVQQAGGIWMILIDPIGIDIAFEFVILSALIGVVEAQALVAYVTSASKPVGAITRTFIVLNQQPAPEIAVFSSAGPSALIQISSNMI